MEYGASDVLGLFCGLSYILCVHFADLAACSLPKQVTLGSVVSLQASHIPLFPVLCLSSRIAFLPQSPYLTLLSYYASHPTWAKNTDLQHCFFSTLLPLVFNLCKA